MPDDEKSPERLQTLFAVRIAPLCSDTKTETNTAAFLLLLLLLLHSC